MQELIEKRNNPEYLNYIAVGEALRILGDGLRYYTEHKMKEMQENLIKNLAGAQCNCLCTPGVKPCKHTCKWAKKLEKLHANKKKSRIPFYQSDSSQWHDPTNGYWEMAKVFMSDLGTKWRDVKDPATTDLTGLLNLLIFCKHFNVQQDLVMAVRELRNECAHAPNLTLSESEKQAAFLSIDKLMNDSELLMCKEVQDCRPGIEEVKNADVSIVHDRDLLVLKELTRHQEFERERKAENERDELMNMIEFILSSNNNYHSPGCNSDNRFKDQLIHVFIVIIRLVLFLFVEVLTCCRRFLPWLLLVALLISYVGDNSVFVSDNGCSRPFETSRVTSFGFNEFDFTTQLSFKRENFFGRSWFFRELGDIFENFHAPVGVLITGDPGSGKSALMSQLICSPFSSSRIYENIVGYHFCDYSEKGTRDGSSFVRNLVDQIASNIPDYADYIVEKKQIRTHLDKRCERDPTACFLTGIIGPLRKLKNKENTFKFIVVDALDECVEKDGETSAILDILRYKMSYFPQWLKIIMSSRNGTTVTSKVPRTVQRMSLDPGDERNVEDIRTYISRYLRKRSSFMSKLWKTISAQTNELTKHGEGNFLFVKTFLEHNVNTDGTIDLNSLPNSLHDIYDQIFQRYFIKEHSVRLETLFEILLAAGSLRETEIFDIFQRQNQGKDIRTLMAGVSSLLHFRQDGTVSIYHKSFAEWLINNDNRINGFSFQKRRGHAYIADFLLERTKNINISMTFKQLSRLCMHVLYSGGPSDEQKIQLKLLNVSTIRNQQNGKCILHELAHRKNGSRLLEIFLPSFTSFDVPDFNGKSPAFYAALEGLVDNLKLFLDNKTCANCILNGVSSSDGFKTAMHMKRYQGSSLMHVATYNGHAKVIDLLLKHNASFIKFNENVPTLLHVAAERGHLDLVKLLYNNGVKADIISLHHAAARNNFHVVKYLLETAHLKDECFQCKRLRFTHPRQNKSLREIHRIFCETALHAAVSKRHINVTKLLLQFGNSTLECKHHSGKTPLMDAVERNDSEMVELLLENGANVEEKCGEETLPNIGGPQTSGAQSFHGKRFLCTFYREKTSCACGNKALHLSAKYGLWHMAKYLINDWNASVIDKNCKGETVWKIANISHNEDFIYHVNRMLLGLDETVLSGKSRKIGVTQRRTFEKLLNKFFIRTKPFQSSFQCDSTFEGMSPLHIAALMGEDMLKRVYKKAHEIAPSLPLNCTNKHWIVPEYLAYFYDSIHKLADESLSHLKQTPRGNNEYRKTMLQYPDREAEFQMIYNYFYESLTEKEILNFYEIFRPVEAYGITNCPGYYDMPTKEVLEPSCDKYTSTTKDTEDLPQSATDTMLQKTQDCELHCEFVLMDCKEVEEVIPNELEEVVFNERAFASSVEEIRELMLLQEYMIDCGCPTIMNILQSIFTRRPRQNRHVNQFIYERMGWKETSSDGKILKRWPLYFFHKKLRNEYQSYKYLDILNEGFEFKTRRRFREN